MNMNKHLNITDYAIRSIIRRFTSHLAVVVGFTIIVFMAASLIFTIRSLFAEAQKILSFSPEITVQYLIGGRQNPIPLKIADKLNEIPGVKAVHPRVWGYLFDQISGANYTIWGVRHEEISRMEAMGLSIVEGGFWKKGERGKIVVGKRLLESLGMGKIRNLTLTGSSGEPGNFLITGFFNAPSSLITVDLILMDEEDARNFLQIRRDFATDITLDVPNQAEVAMIVSKINNLMPSCRVVSRTQILRTYEAVFGYRGGFVLFAWFGCLAAFLILLWNRGISLTSGERRELGLLKAVGWSTSEIMEWKIFETGIVAFFSFFLGFVCAYLHVYVFNTILLRPVLFGWSVLYPEFQLVPVWETGPLLLLLAITFLPFFAVSIMPAWKSASIESDDLLRGGG